MIGKPDVYILSGKSGEKAYNKICNAKPLSKPQYTTNERQSFNNAFGKLIPEIVTNWNHSSGYESK